MKMHNSKPKTRKEFANEYGIDVKTLNAWFKRAGLKIHPGLINPLNQKLIKDNFGDPSEKKES